MAIRRDPFQLSIIRINFVVVVVAVISTIAMRIASQVGRPTLFKAELEQNIPMHHKRDSLL